PEGGALQLAHCFTDTQTLKANGAFFVLDEINQSYSKPTFAPAGFPNAAPSHDPYVYGGQLLWESKWTPKFDTSLGVAALDIAHKDSLSAYVQPFYNVGNS